MSDPKAGPTSDGGAATPRVDTGSTSDGGAATPRVETGSTSSGGAAATRVETGPTTGSRAGSPIAWVRRRLAAMDLSKLLRASAALTLLALGLMVWSMVQPTPLPVMLAMSVGQGLGTLAFALYGYAVIADLRRARRARRARDAAEVPR